MSAPASGTLVFSCGERSPWQLVAPDGTLLGDVAGTPLDPYAPSTFAMGRLANDRIFMAGATYLFTTDNDLTNPNPNPAHYDIVHNTFSGDPFQSDLFSGGTNGTLLYIISVIPPDFFTNRMIEIDPVTWTIIRNWPLASAYGFPAIAVDIATTAAFYSVSTNGKVRKLTFATGVETDFLPAGNFSEGLLILPDDTLLIGTDPVTRYSKTGTLLHTYSKGTGTGNQGGIALGLTSRNSVWVMGPATGVGAYHLWEIEVDTEAILADFELPNNGKRWQNPFAVVQILTPPPPHVCAGCVVPLPTAISDCA